MAETRTILASPSLAPTTTLTRPSLDTNTQISPTLAVILSSLVMFLMVVIFVYIRRMNPNSFDNAMGFHFVRHSPVTRGLDSNIIKSFPTFVYSDVKALKIGKSILECAVCLNEFEDEETLRVIPNCCHVFHPGCIDAWLAFRTTCPVCRTNLKTKSGDTQKLDVRETHVDSRNANSSHEGNDAVIDIHVNSAGQQEVINLSPQISGGQAFNKKSLSYIQRSKSPEFQHLAPKSTPRRPKILGMFTRSHSTGHSLIQPGENYERFTLRLPDDAHKSLVDSRLGMSNVNICVPFSPERSSTKGYRFETGQDRLNKFRFLATPPMFSKPGPSKEEKQPKNLLKSVKSVKSPLSLFCGTEKDESFTYLRPSPSSQ